MKPIKNIVNWLLNVQLASCSRLRYLSPFSSSTRQIWEYLKSLLPPLSPNSGYRVHTNNQDNKFSGFRPHCPPILGYRVHTNNQDNQFSGFRPPTPPILGGKLQKSPPGLGDLGGGDAVNTS